VVFNSALFGRDMADGASGTAGFWSPPKSAPAEASRPGR
jgi:hypothetical protein